MLLLARLLFVFSFLSLLLSPVMAKGWIPEDFPPLSDGISDPDDVLTEQEYQALQETIEETLRYGSEARSMHFAIAIVKKVCKDDTRYIACGTLLVWR